MDTMYRDSTYIVHTTQTAKIGERCPDNQICTFKQNNKFYTLIDFSKNSFVTDLIESRTRSFSFI